MSFLYSLNSLFNIGRIEEKKLLANYIIILAGREGPSLVSLGVEVDTYLSSSTDQLPI